MAAKEYLQCECAKYLRPVGSTSRAVEVGDGGRGFLNSHTAVGVGSWQSTLLRTKDPLPLFNCPVPSQRERLCFRLSALFPVIPSGGLWA